MGREARDWLSGPAKYSAFHRGGWRSANLEKRVTSFLADRPIAKRAGPRGPFLFFSPAAHKSALRRWKFSPLAAWETNSTRRERVGGAAGGKTRSGRGSLIVRSPQDVAPRAPRRPFGSARCVCFVRLGGSCRPLLVSRRVFSSALLSRALLVRGLVLGHRLLRVLQVGRGLPRRVVVVEALPLDLVLHASALEHALADDGFDLVLLRRRLPLGGLRLGFPLVALVEPVLALADAAARQGVLRALFRALELLDDFLERVALRRLLREPLRNGTPRPGERRQRGGAESARVSE